MVVSHRIHRYPNDFPWLRPQARYRLPQTFAVLRHPRYPVQLLVVVLRRSHWVPSVPTSLWASSWCNVFPKSGRPESKLLRGSYGPPGQRGNIREPTAGASAKDHYQELYWVAEDARKDCERLRKAIIGAWGRSHGKSLGYRWIRCDTLIIVKFTSSSKLPTDGWSAGRDAMVEQHRTVSVHCDFRF